MSQSDYGTFAGAVDPANVAEVIEVLSYATDRAADELLTPEQTLGLLNLSIDAITKLRSANRELEDSQ